MTKLQRLKPRATPFASNRKLHTLERVHDEKRLRGNALIARNRRLFQANPLCVECVKMGEDTARARGYTVVVDEWDHKIPLWEGGIDNETNLQGLCFKHHDEKSERERLRREHRSAGVTIA